MANKFCENNVFIIGSRGIPARYGGFETFVEELCRYKTTKNITYHVSCLTDSEVGEFEHLGARCFNVKVSTHLGGSRVIVSDFLALWKSLRYVKKHNLTGSIVYILGCKLSVLLWAMKPWLGGADMTVLLNPDGQEWRRTKWSRPVRAYLKFAERSMVKVSDTVVCDSPGIEEYILKEYKSYNPKTCFIAYGADIAVEDNNTKNLESWLDSFDVKRDEYYMALGRFVPENNYGLIIREFMTSKTTRKLLIISTKYQGSALYEQLKQDLDFENDPRIVFTGPMYDRKLLSQVRMNAYGYIHGHSVGGTNPSLLEALASTRLSICYDVSFNRDASKNGAMYFSDSPGDLAAVINAADSLKPKDLKAYESAAKKRIKSYYNWPNIAMLYERLFLEIASRKRR